MADVLPSSGPWCSLMCVRARARVNVRARVCVWSSPPMKKTQPYQLIKSMTKTTTPKKGGRGMDYVLPSSGPRCPPSASCKFVWQSHLWLSDSETDDKFGTGKPTAQFWYGLV